MKTTKMLAHSLVGTGLMCIHVNVLAAHTQECHVNFFNVSTATSLSDQADGTIVDNTSGLMWKKCLEGQRDLGCTGTPSLVPWEKAGDYSHYANFTHFAEHSDWRLPTLNELKTLVKEPCAQMIMVPRPFPGSQSMTVWSSTEAEFNAWAVNFSIGRSFKSLKAGGHYIRLVRNAG